MRNYLRLAVFSGDLRGAVHARSQWPSPSVEAVPETKWEIFLQVTAGEISQAEAARKWHMGTEPDMDLGCNTFHPRPSGLLRDRGHGLP